MLHQIKKMMFKKNSTLLQKNGSENKRLDMLNQHKMKKNSYLWHHILIHLQGIQFNLLSRMPQEQVTKVFTDIV